MMGSTVISDRWVKKKNTIHYLAHKFEIMEIKFAKTQLHQTPFFMFAHLGNKL